MADNILKGKLTGDHNGFNGSDPVAATFVEVNGMPFMANVSPGCAKDVTESKVGTDLTLERRSRKDGQQGNTLVITGLGQTLKRLPIFL